jgi:hypothetical protein
VIDFAVAGGYSGPHSRRGDAQNGKIDMRRFMLIIALFGLTTTLRTDLQACGNKILVGGRGVRYRLMRAKHAASVLLFNNSSLKADSRIKDPKLYSALKAAGHTFSVATDLNQFEESLTSGRYDLVIADESDVTGLQEAVQASPSKPLLIPILAAKKTSEDDYIKYIDRAIAAKHK